MIPSPSDVTYFIEAANSGNLSRAAERIGISQPSLSQAIVRVEDSLGAKVFHRSKRGVELTRTGKQFLSQARILLAAWDQIRADANAATDEIRGDVSIGIHPSVALYSLGGFLPNILREHPHLRIVLKHDLSRKVTDAVLAMEADIAIAVNPVRHPDLIITKLVLDDVTLWRRQTNPKRSKVIKSDDVLLADEVLIFDPALLQTQYILNKLPKRAGHGYRTIESSNLEVICELVASGCGVGILPTRVAKRASHPLVQIEGAPLYRDEVCLVMRADNRKVASINCIAEGVKGFLKDD
jgi:DNA-binding transcriptional LysR family regulator